DSVRLARRGGESLRDGLQKLIAGIMAQRVVDALEVVEVEEEAGDVRAITWRLRGDLLQALIQERSVWKPRQDVVLRELVGLRRRDFELLGPLRDLVLERPLLGRTLRLRLRQALRHVVERVRQKSQFIPRARRHVDVSPSGADCG